MVLKCLRIGHSPMKSRLLCELLILLFCMIAWSELLSIKFSLPLKIRQVHDKISCVNHSSCIVNKSLCSPVGDRWSILRYCSNHFWRLVCRSTAEKSLRECIFSKGEFAKFQICRPGFRIVVILALSRQLGRPTMNTQLPTALRRDDLLPTRRFINSHQPQKYRVDRLSKNTSARTWADFPNGACEPPDSGFATRTSPFICRVGSYWS